MVKILNSNINHKKYYYDNGSIESEYYFLNEKYHRTDGPAAIYYYKDGNINYK
jgi:hypothetical protein